MENRYFLKECKLVPTEGSSLKQEFEISAGNPLISYYESIKSPAISLTLTFLDVDQLVSREGITGGEYLSLKVKKEGHDDFELKADKHFLMLNSVKDVSTSSSKQVATLEFVSVETIVNETARVNKKYTGNISDTVMQLLIGDKRGIGTSKKLFGPVDEKLGETDVEKDRATNSYSFVGNLKRPFDTIQWLCPKAASTDDECGFLFYETLDGYYFKSIKTLLEGEPIVYEKPEKTPTPAGIGDFKIIENNLDTSNDVGMNCRMGMYSNKTIYINIDNATEKIVDYRISGMNLKKPPKLPNKLEDFPTRLMLRVLDKGALQKGSKKEEIQKENELAIYQSKSYARANLIFSQSMGISIPFNPELRAGQMLDLKFPLRKGDDQATTTYGSESDDDVSGKYLISELKHIIGGNRANTELTLIRDMFTA